MSVLTPKESSGEIDPTLDAFWRRFPVVRTDERGEWISLRLSAEEQTEILRDSLRVCNDWTNAVFDAMWRGRGGNGEDPIFAPAETPDLKIDVCIYTAEHLKKRPQAGVQTMGGITWEQLVRLLAAERSKPGDPNLDPNVAKAARGGWAAGTYLGGIRSRKAWGGTTLLVIDIDRNGDIDRVAKFLSRYRKIAHTTYKSTPDAPRCRVVLVLDRRVCKEDEYKALHASIVDAMIRSGTFVEGDVDRGASDVCRLNYLPMHQPGQTPRSIDTGGELVPVDKILAATQPVRAEQRRGQGQHRGGDRVEAARRYVSKIPVPRCGTSSCHEVVWKVALHAARGFDLTEEQAFGVMSSWCSPGGDCEQRTEAAYLGAIKNALDSDNPNHPDMGFHLNGRGR